MDFFTELLDSFGKLKKRKLKLLESNDPEQLALSFIQKASGGQRIPVGGSNPNASVWIAKSGNNLGLAVFNGFNQVIGIDPNKNPDGFKKFVGYLSGEDRSTGQEQSGYQKMGPGGKVANSQFADENMEDALEIQEIIQNIAISLPMAFEGIDKKFLDPKWEDFNMFSNYMYGGSPQSLESHLLNIKTKILYDDLKKEYVTLQVPPDPESLKEVAKNMQFLIDCLGQNNIESKKDKLVQKFAIATNGQVSVISDTDDSGLVFSDQTGFFKSLLAAASEKFQIQFRKIDIKKQVSEGIDNNIRGVALEEILPILAMQRKLMEFAGLGAPNPTLANGIQASMGIIKDKLIKLLKGYESWVIAHQQSALSPEDVELINGVGTLLGKDGSRLISAIVATSKDSIAVRQPDWIITKGRETGEGRRQDTFEIFSDFNKAKIALVKMGYSEQEIAMNGMIKTVPVEEAFGERQDSLAVALSSGVFKKGQPVFYTPISLKNYMSLDKAVFGTSTANSTSDFVKGVSKDPQNLFLAKFKETVGPQFEQAHKQVIKYDSDLSEIWDKVGKVPSTVKARSSRGSLVQSKPFKEFISNTLDIIKANSKYEELVDNKSADNPKTKLVSMISRYLESDEDNEDLQNKIKAYTAQYTKNTKLIGDVASGDTNAKYFLAMKLFNAGAAVDDGMICDYRGLATKETYNFKQNDIMREVIQSFLTNDGKWMLKARNNTFVFYNQMNPKMRVTMVDKIERKEGIDKKVNYTSKTVVEVNRDLMKSYNRKKSTKEAMIESWMDYQKFILTQLVG